MEECDTVDVDNADDFDDVAKKKIVSTIKAVVTLMAILGWQIKLLWWTTGTRQRTGKMTTTGQFDKITACTKSSSSSSPCCKSILAGRGFHRAADIPVVCF